MINIKELQYGTFIRLKKDAEPTLSYSSKEIPRKYIEDGGLRAIDGIEDLGEGNFSININRVETPYPGAFCSFITLDEIEEIVSKKNLNFKNFQK